MSDHEHARLMLRMAGKDHTALQGMLDTQIFADAGVRTHFLKWPLI
jgi:hypothetical protein